MKMAILSYADVANTIGVALMDRGHTITWFAGGAVYGHGGNVHPGVAEMVNDNDGCLALGDEPELQEIARLFRDAGKIVWREWTDIPPTREWPNGGYLAS
jgi:hypothetical protein